MFLFLRKESLVKRAARSAALMGVVLFCLLTALLFTGCKTDDDDDPVEGLDANLLGIWISIGQWGADGYIITGNRLSYGDGVDAISSLNYAGTIRYASQFADDAGVIIIEYDADYKASYWEYDDDWNPTVELPLKGNFIGIYYKDLKPGVSASMGGAYIDGGAEEATLETAKAAFTMANEGKYITYGYGNYSYRSIVED